MWVVHTEEQAALSIHPAPSHPSSVHVSVWLIKAVPNKKNNFQVLLYA